MGVVLAAKGRRIELDHGSMAEIFVTKHAESYLIPSRQQRPGDDPIFTLNALAKQRLAAGDDIVNATIGALLNDDGRLAVMPSVVEALAAVPPEVAAAYAPIAGNDEFRQAVVHDLLGPHGLDDLGVAVATPGGSGALRMAIDDFVEPGRELLTTSFFWGPYRTLSDESGRVLTSFEMFDHAGRFNVEALDAALSKSLATQGRALVILNTPCHNPTGYALDADEWREVVGVLERQAARGPVVLVVDIAYAYYAKKFLDVAIESLKPIVDKVMVLFAWSASKSFAQYGLRVGALVAVVPDAAGRKKVDNALTYSCRGTFSNCNAAGMAAITHVLTDDQLRARALAERAELVTMLAQRVAYWNQLAQGTAIRYPRYQGGFFTTVFCDDAPGMAARLRDRGVFVVPTAGAMRVALCSVNEKQIARLVSTMLAVLQ
jgi:aromatic-amino-acid transaminase